MSKSENWTQIVQEVRRPIGPDGGALCFQAVIYHYGETNQDEGYRFIWRDPKGNQMSYRGQARIPAINDLCELIASAIGAGWVDRKDLERLKGLV